MAEKQSKDQPAEPNVEQPDPAEAQAEHAKAEAAAGIEPGNPAAGQAVVSVTSEVPHPADASSAPGPYEDLPIDRPPVSTSRPDQPIAQSLIAGAGAGDQGQPEIAPEDRKADS